ITMDDGWWQTKLQELPNKPLETMGIMYAQLDENAPVTPQILAALLQSQALYDCGIAPDGVSYNEVTDKAVDMVRVCLDRLLPNVHDANFPELLGKPLAHPNAAIRSTVLRYVKDQLQQQSKPLPNNKLLLLVLDELQQQETRASGLVMQILDVQLLQWLTDSQVLDQLVNLLQQNDVTRCRVYELGVMLAKHSPAALEAVEFILDAALTELLGSSDVLLMCSVMEILVPLAEQNHGLSFMERRGVLETIGKHVENYREGSINSTLLLPGIMKFFGKVAVVQPQKVIQGYPYLLNCLVQLLMSDELDMLPIGMETMANLLSSTQGKTLLQTQLPSQLPQLFAKYGEYLVHSAPPLKLRLLESLDVIYTTDGKPSNEIISLLGGWYETIAGGLQIDHLLKLINTPFADLQIAALGYLKTICQFDWGVKAVQETAGAIEFLLSRQQQLDNNVKYLKWQVMELLSVSAAFSPSEIVRFTAYVKEGPYYVPTQVNIATEGSN
ncbi:hypothetical protein KR093_004026, partial [Drosophila rubida]